MTEKSPDAVTAAVAQGPHVQTQINSDKQQNVSEYLAQIYSSYQAQLNNQQQRLSNGKLSEITPQEKVQNQAKEQQLDKSESQEHNQQPEPQQPKAIQDSQPGQKSDMVPDQRGSREAEDYALSVVQMLDQRRLNVDRLQIDVNGQIIFKMKDGDIDPHNTSITTEHTELIKQALGDPASLKGSVKITQGSQTLLHVKDGRVLIDSVGISKQSAKVKVKTPDSPSQGLYERFSEGVNRNGLQATQEIATNALKSGIQRDQVIDMLKAHDLSYQKLARAQGEKGADRLLEKMLETAEVKLMQEQMPQQQQAQQIKSSRSVKV